MVQISILVKVAEIETAPVAPKLKISLKMLNPFQVNRFAGGRCALSKLVNASNIIVISGNTVKASTPIVGNANIVTWKFEFK